MGILKDYEPYVPIKVSCVGVGNEIKKMYIFVGYQKKEIQHILGKSSRTKHEEEILSKKFGKNWKRVLGIERIQIGGGKRIRGRSKGRSKSRSRSKGRGEGEILEEEEIAPRRIEDTEEELLKVLEEMEKESIEEETKRLEELRSTEPEIKIVVGGVKIQYVFDYINSDDSINTIKKKIYIWSKIPMVEQHIFYIRDSKVFEGEKEIVSMQYDIVNLESKGKLYPLNILANNGIDIDRRFIKEYETNRILTIRDHGNLLLNEFENFDRNLYFADLEEFLGSAGSRQNIMADPREVYQGFVLKYFPGISPDAFREILEKKYVNPEKVGTLERDFSDIQKQINVIHEIGIEKIKEKKLKILTMSWKVNFDEISKITGRILNARNLFDAFEVDNVVPYIKFKDTEKVYHKVFKLFYNENLTLVEKKWKPTEPQLLSFRMKTEGASYASVNVFDDGRMEVRNSWPEAENINLEKANKVIETLKEVVKKINELEGGVFVGEYRIPDPVGRVSGINVVGDLEMKVPDYKNLALLSKIFNGYLVVDTEKRIETTFSVYYRYLRTSVEFRKGAKLRRETRNEVLFSEEFPESGIIQDPLGKTIKGIDVHLVGQWSPKLFIAGSKTIKEMEEVYNFMMRFIYIFENIEKFDIVQDKWETLKGVIKKKEDIEGREVKLVRKLQHIDPVLFDFERTGKVEFYSRLCQSAQQPLPLTDAEFEQVKDEYEEVLRYGNKTYPGQFLNYVCPSHAYKFPGFLPKEKHPKGFCLPCCYKTSSQKVKSRKHKIFKECMRLEYGKELTSEEDPAREESNRRYIKNWGKPIQEGRLGLIPPGLHILFNKKDCRISKLNMLERNSKCFLIFGINQDEASFITCIATAVLGAQNVVSSVEAREKMLTFLDKMVEHLRSNKQIFDMLENGEVKREFGTLDTFIEYLETGGGGSGIDDKYVLDLFSNFNVYKPDGVNIVIFTEDAETGKVSISCSGRTYSLLESFENPHRRTIVLVKSGKYYHPIFRISTDNSPMANITVQRMFEKNQEIIKIIVKMFEYLCDIGGADDKFAEYKRRFGINLMPNAEDILRILPRKYEIKSQVLGRSGIEWLNIKEGENVFAFPVGSGSPKLSDVEIGKRKNGKSRVVKKFIEILDKEYGLQITNTVVRGKVLLGYLLNSNYFVWVREGEKDTEFPEMVLKHDITDIDKFIGNGVQQPDERIVEMKKINLNMDTYKMLILEISEYLFRQRNKEIRKKIERIFDRYPGNSMEDYKKIKDKLFELGISTNDLVKLDAIVREMFVDETEGLDLFEETTFEFDGIFKKEIEENLEKRRIEKIVREIVDEVSILGKAEENPGNVLSICTTKKKSSCEHVPWCVWDSKGKCKVVIEGKKEKEDLIKRITEEIIKNDIIRNNILYHRVDIKLDPSKFTLRNTEKIMITPLRSLS